MIKRWFILSGMMAFFVLVVLAFTACSALTEGANDGLSNAIGSKPEGSPGSGSWKVPQPTNGEQCNDLNNVLTTLSEDTVKINSQVDQRFNRCYDENFKLRDGQKEENCKPVILRQYDFMEKHLFDFHNGKGVYVDRCEGGVFAEEGEEEDPKVTPVATAEGKNPTPQDPEDTDTWGCCWCLTCIHHIDIEYVLRPTTIDLPDY